MFEIRQAIVDDRIAHTEFACDIQACKGACCTLPGGKGAPLLDSEIRNLEEAFPIVKSTLPGEHREAIVRSGLYEGEPGSYTTTCYDNRACVFVFYEAGIARCSFEKAFKEGKSQWRKPQSCHLFPVRIDGERPKRLRYEWRIECEPALRRGCEERIFLADFVRDALIRTFGKEWYEEFVKGCETRRFNSATEERSNRTDND
jgi:hypothetical protein